MSYSLKNKVLVLFAITLSFGVSAYGAKAQEMQGADITPPAVAEPMTEEQGNPVAPEVVNDDPFGLDDATSENGADSEVPQNFGYDERMPDMRDRGVEPQKNFEVPEENFGMNQPSDGFPSPEGMPDVSLDDMGVGFASDAGLPDVTIDGAAPKSTFEKFGNAILSRVDNDLFNQMSEIEKQTTLLNLELKREEVKNRIEALKAQRERARQEELNLEAEREKKARDEELARQKALLQEQIRLKEKEMEVEKIRQAKILNEYMNETLMNNQQWVETNGKLIAEIKKLQEERKNLIDEVGARLEEINRKTVLALQNAEETKIAFERKISSFNKQINGLKQVIVEKESALLSAAEEIKEANPFANGDVIDENAVDMSKEYAIMDITGKGDNVVAKIVSQDGTTFMVRKGSVLKGGETVVKITDEVITFDNHGAKS